MYLVRDKALMKIEQQTKYPTVYIPAIQLIDITSMAIRKQKKLRYLKLKNGVYLRIDIIVLYNYKKRKGFFRFIHHNVTIKEVNQFIKDIGIDPSVIYHDKGYIFKFGIQYHTQRIKVRIESLFSFKKQIYKAYKNKEIKTSKDLFRVYREWFKKKGLIEV